MTTPVLTLLNTIEPIAKLSSGRKQELANLCFVETVSKGVNPLRMNISHAKQAVYLTKGELELHFIKSGKVLLRANTAAAQYPINHDPDLTKCIAVTDVEILRIDYDLLDIMMTWDQLSAGDNAVKQEHKAGNGKSQRTPIDWMRDPCVFSVEKLQSGVFSKVPVANIEAMFQRMERINTVAGQVMIKQGAMGDYYYLIESGFLEVSRAEHVNANPVVVAELKEGDAFGEEALVSDNKRNATVTMKSDGQLLRLSKRDFVELLKEPMLTRISGADAEIKIADGAIVVDVRLPSEYQYDYIAGAINIPLSEIRKQLPGLDKNLSYVVYCQTGRRSSAAAFILAQHGFDVMMLNGGTKANVL